jgi:hypothetical protein
MAPMSQQQERLGNPSHSMLALLAQALPSARMTLHVSISK